MTEQQNDQQCEKPSVLHIVLSTVAAAFGVQSNKNRERDFKGGNIYIYIAAGVIFTTVFVLAVMLVVRTVLASAGL
jgi:hypothetical protein